MALRGEFSGKGMDFGKQSTSNIGDGNMDAERPVQHAESLHKVRHTNATVDFLFYEN